MKLYALSSSRFADRCRIQIVAKGIDVEIVELPYPLPASYRSINPLGKVPALDTGTQILVESEVICEYLEDRGKGTSLRPEDVELRARMRLLVRLLDLYVSPPLETLYRVSAGKEQLDPTVTNEMIAQRFHSMAPFLSSKKYAVSNQLTLADCALMSIFLRYRLLCPLLGLADPLLEQPFAGYYEQTYHDPWVKNVLSASEQILIRQLSHGKET